VFLDRQPRLHLKGVGPASHKVFVTFYMHAHSMRNNNHILHIKLYTRKIFTRSTANSDVRSVYCS